MSAVIDWNVKPIAVREDGLVGTLFLPTSPPPHPVVITLGGSAPGIFTPPAALLASNGIAALALAYFGVEQLPRALKQIPLEYFGTAIQWCSRREELSAKSVAVAGGSRGGELALLLAATFPEIVAVVGWSASGLLYGGIDKPDRPVAAWTIAGRDLPFAGFVLTAVNWNERPVRMSSGFVDALSDEKTVRAAEIPVERINGPVLLISGTDDQVWPSSMLSEIAIRRLRNHHHPFHYEHLSYEGAGHGIGPPFGRPNTTHFVHPVLGYDFEFGGTPDLNQNASLDSWQHIVAFLKTSLET